MKEIFNVISYSVDSRWKEGVEGYTCPDSELRTLKIWYSTDAWQRLVVISESPQSITLSMVIHRMIGCKETTNLLSCADFGHSYTKSEKQRNLLMMQEIIQVLLQQCSLKDN